MEKVNTAYQVLDSRKFNTLDEADKEARRSRAACYRLKEKYPDVDFIIAVSETDADVSSGVIYDRPKNQGGRKRFYATDPKTGEIHPDTPELYCEPHIHIAMRGFGANSCAEGLLKNLKKRNGDIRFSKKHMKTQAHVDRVFNDYFPRQASHLYRV